MHHTHLQYAHSIAVSSGFGCRTTSINPTGIQLTQIYGKVGSCLYLLAGSTGGCGRRYTHCNLLDYDFYCKAYTIMQEDAVSNNEIQANKGL